MEAKRPRAQTQASHSDAYNARALSQPLGHALRRCSCLTFSSASFANDPLAWLKLHWRVKTLSSYESRCQASCKHTETDHVRAANILVPGLLGFLLLLLALALPRLHQKLPVASTPKLSDSNSSAEALSRRVHLFVSRPLITSVGTYRNHKAPNDPMAPPALQPGNCRLPGCGLLRYSWKTCQKAGKIMELVRFRMSY